MASPHLFGIRHHGPGSARSLVRAFEALRADCVLIEGPPECDGLIGSVLSDGMCPPVALLSYCPDEPRLAVYHPFAEFSPEWQALRWSAHAGVPARFIDLPLVHGMALDKAEREKEVGDAAPASPKDAANEETSARETLEHADPLQWLAEAAGYADGESWWNHMVEERGDGEMLFAAIAEAMVMLRSEAGERRQSEAQGRRELLREAHMRQSIRTAQKEGFERIAVVCGAWHLGGLLADIAAKADLALLKGLPKVKVQSTWVPWTYRHLTRASGYGAGIKSPGWYEHLWKSHDASHPRAIGWLSRVATLMRQRDLDCSSAHLIEAARLADALAALRERPAPGLEELHEATRTVLTLGDEAVLHFIGDALVVGDRFGSVPPDVPTVPLQRDLEQAQRTLRLKPEALQKTLDLDLRSANDLARSHLLHRLNLLDVPWGSVAGVGRSSRGTFHEVWTLQWQPEFALRLIEASLWGQTIVQAATARVIDRCARLEDLADLSAVVDRVLLAELELAVSAATRALENRAAVTGDALQLLGALPPLANVYRYGNVRQTDAAMVGHVLDGLIVRAAISLPLSATSIDDDAADALRGKLLGAHAAVALRQGDEQTEAWQRSLGQLSCQTGAHELLQGLAMRLLFDSGRASTEETAQALSLHLSSGSEPSKAAAWLDGFLNRNAVVLLHDTALWRLVDTWLAGLAEDHFVRILPLIRRTFSMFAAGDRRELGFRARHGVEPATRPVAAVTWDTARAELALPRLRQLLGIAA